MTEPWGHKVTVHVYVEGDLSKAADVSDVYAEVDADPKVTFVGIAISPVEERPYSQGEHAMPEAANLVKPKTEKPCKPTQGMSLNLVTDEMVERVLKSDAAHLLVQDEQGPWLGTKPWEFELRENARAVLNAILGETEKPCKPTRGTQVEDDEPHWLICPVCIATDIGWAGTCKGGHPEVDMVRVKPA
jgi:hypothetical protein